MGSHPSYLVHSEICVGAFEASLKWQRQGCQRNHDQSFQVNFLLFFLPAPWLLAIIPHAAGNLLWGKGVVAFVPNCPWAQEEIGQKKTRVLDRGIWQFLPRSWNGVCRGGRGRTFPPGAAAAAAAAGKGPLKSPLL